VPATVVPAERFAGLLSGHPRAADVLQRQAIERREEDRARLSLGEPAGAERRLAWLLLELARRRGGYQQAPATAFTLPMSQQELADWAGTSADAVGRFLRSWRERGIIARSERSRRLTVGDLDGLAAICDAAPAEAEAGQARDDSRPPGATRDMAAWLGGPAEPLNCSVLFTDVAGFGDPKRTDGDREAVREALYGISRSALEASGVPWAECYYEDRGDGTVIVVPPHDRHRAGGRPADPGLASRLRQYNRRASEVVQIQLRVALHVGPVGRDAEGLTGEAVIVAARILDVPVLKARLAADQAGLMFAASGYVYDHVIRHCVGRVDSATVEHVDYLVKKTRVPAWVTWLIGRQGRYAEAMELVSQVLGGRRHTLGAGHPDTLASRAFLAWLAAREDSGPRPRSSTGNCSPTATGYSAPATPTARPPATNSRSSWPAS
jgi:hypothetical protein